MHQPSIRPLIRRGRDEDAAAIIALIGRCWADYPGCVLDVDAEAPELRALASYYAGLGGALWVADDVAGMVASRPLDGGAWELCRMYVHPDRHGSGLAHRLMYLADGYAVAAGATELRLWTDTRFDRAHRFYEKRGFTRGEKRRLDDLSHSEEWLYARAVGR